jgi:hypothetical protein
MLNNPCAQTVMYCEWCILMFNSKFQLFSCKLFYLAYSVVLYILQGILPITVDATIYYVLSDKLHGHIFQTLGGHLQAIKVH